VRKSWEIATIALSASLYAVIGYASYLGIFTPMIGVVRFWPSVFIPAVFAVLFGPRVGGISAAIGIFISDMMIHGNALLSLSVGVPANFVCFYSVGWFTDKIKNNSRLWIIMAISEEIFLVFLIAITMKIGMLSSAVAIAYIIGIGVALFFTILYGFFWSKNHVLMFAYNTGLLMGSLIIGVGIYLFSQIFVLPGGAQKLSLEAIILWSVWTYATEIPFMVALSTPIIVIGNKVLPKVRGE